MNSGKVTSSRFSSTSALLQLASSSSLDASQRRTKNILLRFAQDEADWCSPGQVWGLGLRLGLGPHTVFILTSLPLSSYFLRTFFLSSTAHLGWVKTTWLTRPTKMTLTWLSKRLFLGCLWANLSQTLMPNPYKHVWAIVSSCHRKWPQTTDS